ncbi:MAG: DUF5003 domain-containing protein [Alistipes sp.]|nr:DUF5003 domain-containing protein [Alistipes sp.]
MRHILHTALTTLLVAIVTLCSLGSCSKEASIPELPNMINIICNAGTQQTLSFTIGANWRLSSNQPWCKFVTSGGELLEMAGNAGSHTITLNITDENIKNQPTMADITIYSGGMEAVIARVERGANELYMRINDVTDTPQNGVKIGYIDWIPFRVEANFRFHATEWPEWVEIGQQLEGNETITPVSGITGVPGESTEAFARIVNNNEREKYAITDKDGYTIKFANEEGNKEFEFPILYAGMGNDQIRFVGPTDKNWGWEVSLNGKEFRQTDEMSGTTTTFNESLEFEIIAQNDVYHIVYVECKIERGLPTYECKENYSWMYFNQYPAAGEPTTLSIDAAAGTRYGMVLCFDAQVYNKIRYNIKDWVFVTDDSTTGISIETLNPDYEKYVLIDFTQRDFAEQDPEYGMYIYHSMTTLEIPASEYKNNSIMEQYGVNEAYSCPFVNSVEGKHPGIIIKPNITEWTTLNCEAGNATAEVWYKGDKLKISEGEYYLGENKDEEMSLHLWGPNESFDEDVHIIFKVNDEPRKLLVVTPPAE